MVALYSEIDPFAAQWLRQSIIAGHIAPGIVVEDSIEDLHPNDLKPFAQVHLFAGIGVWSYSLRRIGWPDDRRIWTCSCPCQPFSAAGKGGGFDDERHLWPHAYHLITQCRPDKIVGEQFASPDGLAWLDLVQTDMETAGYAFGAVDLCAAGVGAPHIRQRTYWMADSDGQSSRQGGANNRGGYQGSLTQPRAGLGIGCGFDRLDHHHHTGLEGLGGGYRAEAGQRQGSVRPVTETGEFGGVANVECVGRQMAVFDNGGRRTEGFVGQTSEFGMRGAPEWGAPGPTNGFWRDVDWLGCRDDKWRPVEPGTFPLAHGVAARVGRLRGYGNAIVAPLAEEFLRAALLDEPVK